MRCPRGRPRPWSTTPPPCAGRCPARWPAWPCSMFDQGTRLPVSLSVEWSNDGRSWRAHDARLVDAELHPAGLGVLHRRTRHGADLGVGYHAARAEDSPSVPTTRMVSGDAMTTSKLMLPAFTWAARSPCRRRRRQRHGLHRPWHPGEHRHALGLPVPLRARQRRARPGRTLGVDACCTGHVDGPVELGGRRFLHDAQRIAWRVQLGAVDSCGRAPWLSGQLGHGQTLPP